MRRERPKTIPEGAWTKALAETRERMASGDWEGAAPRNLLALYALLHETVYGIAPGELTSATRLYAAGAAGRMLKADFDDDAGAMAEFMRWLWGRERKREAWRRENGRDGQRIGWRLQFNTQLVTDYRLALARTQGKP
jgi:hypothetical protein